MKYVKVLMYNEFALFEVIEEYDKTIKCKLRNCEDGYMILSKNNIIKQADTIEELCDWFFLESAKGYPVNYKKFYTAKRFKERMKIEQELYGVIYIRGKGLIYTAKMNNKGELVLL